MTDRKHADVIGRIEGLDEQISQSTVLGDATDSDFWQRLRPGRIRLVMLTLPELSANLDVVERLADSPYDGTITAVARFADEVEILQQGSAGHPFYHLLYRTGHIDIDQVRPHVSCHRSCFTQDQWVRAENLDAERSFALLEEHEAQGVAVTSHQPIGADHFCNDQCRTMLPAYLSIR